jgi:hypothetical protein
LALLLLDARRPKSTSVRELGEDSECPSVSEFCLDILT